MPDVLVHVLAVLAAGLGGVCRLLLDGVITERIARRDAANPLPWGIIAVNLSGSLLIGVVAGALALSTAGGAVAASSAVAPWPFAVSFGFLGGYTTFSTASVQSVRLAQAGRWGAASITALGQLAAAVALVGAGWALAWWVVGGALA